MKIGEDHPRLCGNDLMLGPPAKPSAGSPPLVRERHATKKDDIIAVRITPACAGTTTTMWI